PATCSAVYKTPRRRGHRPREFRAVSRCPWPSDESIHGELDGQLPREAYGRVTRDTAAAQLNRTYSNSIGRLLIPRAGGEIQLANLPGSTTRPMNDVTNA